MRQAGESCETCAAWHRLSVYRGECRKSAFETTTYKLVGTAGRTEVFEETKPDYWCTLYQAAERVE